jgi:hypothetical protein
VQGRQQVQPDSNCLRLFDVGTGREVRNIPMPAGCTIHQLAYSFDGRLLISENTDKTISLWEVASGQERSRFGQAVAPGPQSISTTFVAINGNFRVGPALAPLGVTVAVSRDGSLIAAPGVNHSIKIFDASLGKEVGTFRGHDGAVTSLVFSPDSKTLLSGSGDTSVLGWDLARLKREPRPPVAAEPKVLDRLWADLIDSDAKKAGQSLQMLLSATNGSVALLSERIQPAAPVDITKVEQWLRDLDSSNFKQRALATRELQKLGELAIPALQKVLATRPSLEIRRRVEPMLEDLTGRNLSPEQIRIVRAIEVLDKIGTPEAKQLLERLAGGAPGSLTTLQAQMSLDRLNASK